MNSKIFGSGKDIVFLHGWGGDTSAFFFVAKRLSPNFRVTLLDLPGFGESAEPSVPYTVSDYAEEVLQVLDNYNISDAIFVGHSFGGRVAMEIASKNKDRVKALVLIDSAGLKPRRKLKYYIKVICHKICKKLGFSGLKGSSDYQKLSPIMKNTFKNVVNYYQDKELENISQPTAIFWGRDDTETPPYMAKRLNKGIADSELFWLDGDHFAYIYDYESFYIILTAFLRAVGKIEEKEAKLCF